MGIRSAGEHRHAVAFTIGEGADVTADDEREPGVRERRPEHVGVEVMVDVAGRPSWRGCGRSCRRRLPPRPMSLGAR